MTNERNQPTLTPEQAAAAIIALTTQTGTLKAAVRKGAHDEATSDMLAATMEANDILMRHHLGDETANEFALSLFKKELDGL